MAQYASLLRPTGERQSRTHSSAGERSLHTGEVQGSIPCASTRRAQENKHLQLVSPKAAFCWRPGGAVNATFTRLRCYFKAAEHSRLNPPPRLRMVGPEYAGSIEQ